MDGAVTIRVAIVDDHPLVTAGLRAALGSEPDVDVVADAPTVAAALRMLEEYDLDVVIVDVRLPDGSGLDLISRAAASPENPASIVLSSFDTPQYVDAAMRLGAAGFLLKTAPTAEIVAAIRAVAAGGTAYAVSLSRSGRRWQPLTARERAVVDGVLRGRSNDEIGVELGLSRKTVEAHLSRLFERFGVGTRTDLALRADRERWLDMPSLEPRGRPR